MSFSITSKVTILYNFNVVKDNHDREATFKEVGIKNKTAQN